MQRVVGDALAAALAASLAAASPALAAATGPGPLDAIRQSTDRILAVLRDPALAAPEKKAERRQKILDIVDERFNWPDMAQRALARHWAPRSPQERAEFVPLFTDLIRYTYLGKVEGYAGENVRYKGEQIEGDYARVDVVIVTTKGVDVPVQYSLKKIGAEWRIYDVAVEGVRLVNNYRTQFNSMLNSMTYPKFVEKLKEKVAELRKEEWPARK